MTYFMGVVFSTDNPHERLASMSIGGSKGLVKGGKVIQTHIVGEKTHFKW